VCCFAANSPMFLAPRQRTINGKMLCSLRRAAELGLQPVEAHPAVPGWSICSIRLACADDRGREDWVARARSLSEFQTSFPDETGCAAFLFQRRWPEGFVCPACAGGRAALLNTRAHTYECLDCGRQTSITAGMAMHWSKLPLTVWFWAAHLGAWLDEDRGDASPRGSQVRIRLPAGGRWIRTIGPP
jgi:predicted RNA-binding Zn-ribbon protein involved in translation (DUF1610 family)